MYKAPHIQILLTCIFFAFSVRTAMAWGGGHDLIGQWMAEFLHPEIQEFFTDENRKQLPGWSHYPDLPKKSVEEIEAIVGTEDATFLGKHGCRNSMWLHGVDGRACSALLLTKAFREKRNTPAAFYLSELSHSVSDGGALNHTPMMLFLMCILQPGLAPIPYSQLTDAKMNSVDLGSADPETRQTILEDLKQYQPEMMAESVPEFLYQVQSLPFELGATASEREADVAFGDRSRRGKALAEIGKLHAHVMLDIAWTAWQLAQTDQPLQLPEDFHTELARRSRQALGQLDARRDSVFRELFTKEQKPTNATMIGLLLEPYTYSCPYSSFASQGRLITAGAGRVFRDHGYPIRPLNLPEVETGGLPSPADMPILFLSPGPCRISEALAKTISDYTENGGKLIWVGGEDPKALTGAIGKSLRKRANEEVPTSTAWSLQNEDVLPNMVITFDGPLRDSFSGEYKFKKNPNINGASKPRCQVSIELTDPSIRPLIWLDNGKERFCIGAGTERAVWLPEYVVSPYVLSDDSSIGYFPEFRLDSFGAPVVLEALRFLLGKG